jgi:DHA3 family tetracycline resistance protein-like MFS transporter
VLVGVVLESMTFLFEIPTGVVADLYSRRLSVILGIFLTGCGFLIETLIPAFAVILLGQVVWGIGFTFYSGAEAAWITDEIGVDQAHAVFLRATQVGQMLSIAGTFCGAALSQIGIALPVVVGAALFLLLAASLYLFMPETGFQPAVRGQRPRVGEHLLRPLHDSLRFVRVHPLLWMILLLGAIIGLYVGGFDRLYTPHYLRDVTLPTVGQAEPVVWLGIINGLVNIGSLAGMEMVRRRYRTTDQGVIINVLLALYSGMIVGGLVFALSGTFVLAAAGFCLSQTLRNIGRPLIILWVNQNAEKQMRATLISAYWQANALGQIVGSPLLGWLGTTSLRLALGVGVGVYTATLPLLLFARRRWKQVRQSARAPATEV